MRFLANLTISKKIVGAFAVIVLTTIAVGAVTYDRVSFIQLSNERTQHTYKVLDQVNALVAAMLNQETGLRGYLISGDPDFLTPYHQGLKAYETAFTQIMRLTADDPEQQERLQRLNEFAAAWKDKVASVQIAKMQHPDTVEEARAIEVSGAGKALTDSLRAVADEILQVELKRLAERAARQGDAFGTTYLVTVAGAVLALAFAALAGWLLTRGISVPIVRMTGVMSKLAAGNKGVEVPGLGRGDEIGAMADAVEVFKENAIEAERLAAADAAEQEAKAARAQRLDSLVRDFETKIAAVVTELSEAAGGMQKSATSMAATAERTNRQSMAVASAAEQASNNVQTVAGAAEELTASINEIGQQVTQSTEITRTAVASAASANEVVSGLAEGAQKIGEVVDLINDIAEQTNLLALNATIEAARAGEAGKGFAVVASEVKGLANQTAKATEEIAGQIGSVQGATQEAVARINDITEVIGRISEIAASIASAVEEQGAATQEITRNVQEAAKGTAEVSGNIAGVTDAAAETSSSADDIGRTAEALSRSSDGLKAEVETFLGSVKTA